LSVKIYTSEFGVLDADELSSQLAQLNGKLLWKIQREARAEQRHEEWRRECQREMVRWEKIKKEERRKARGVKVREVVDTFPRRYFRGWIPQKTPVSYLFQNGRQCYGGDVCFGVLEGIRKSRFE